MAGQVYFLPVAVGAIMHSFITMCASAFFELQLTKCIVCFTARTAFLQSLDKYIIPGLPCPVTLKIYNSSSKDFRTSILKIFLFQQMAFLHNTYLFWWSLPQKKLKFI